MITEDVPDIFYEGSRNPGLDASRAALVHQAIIRGRPILGDAAPWRTEADMESAVASRTVGKGMAV